MKKRYFYFTVALTLFICSGCGKSKDVEPEIGVAVRSELHKNEMYEEYCEYDIYDNKVYHSFEWIGSDKTEEKYEYIVSDGKIEEQIINGKEYTYDYSYNFEETIVRIIDNDTASTVEERKYVNSTLKNKSTYYELQGELYREDIIYDAKGKISEKDTYILTDGIFVLDYTFLYEYEYDEFGRLHRVYENCIKNGWDERWYNITNTELQDGVQQDYYLDGRLCDTYIYRNLQY